MAHTGRAGSENNPKVFQLRRTSAAPAISVLPPPPPNNGKSPYDARARDTRVHSPNYSSRPWHESDSADAIHFAARGRIFRTTHTICPSRAHLRSGGGARRVHGTLFPRPSSFRSLNPFRDCVLQFRRKNRTRERERDSRVVPSSPMLLENLTCLFSIIFITREPLLLIARRYAYRADHPATYL